MSHANKLPDRQLRGDGLCAVDVDLVGLSTVRLGRPVPVGSGRGLVGRRVSRPATISDRNIPARGHLALLVVVLLAASIGEVLDGHADGEWLAAIAPLDLDLGRG